MRCSELARLLAGANGTSLHYRTAGSGPAVVLLHGVPKTSYHWRHLVPKLTPHHTVVTPDLRGLGDSARPAYGCDSAAMSDDIAALMAHLGHDTYSVVGEDWGAVIGYQLAARHRDHVSALVFAEALFPGFGFEDHTALTRENVSRGMHLWHLGFYFQPDVMRLFAHDVTGHLFDAGHDLAEEVPDEMAEVVLPFLAKQT
ncbi:alpha/beta fold hydrolase [Streptomyces iakyrus]